MSRSDICHALEYLTFTDGFGLIPLDHVVKEKDSTRTLRR
jgi:hypothetical protein